MKGGRSVRISSFSSSSACFSHALGRTYPGGLVVTYAYDALNRMASVKDWLNQTTSYTYDPAGNLTEETTRVGTECPGAGRLLAKRSAYFTSFGESDLEVVQLVDSRGDVAWEGRTEGTRLAVPPAAALTPGQRYFAWVIAHLSSGATVRSPAVGFRLAPG